MINKDQVKHIAKLARLGLSEGEIEDLQKDLSSILDYVSQMQEVNVDGIEPLSHAVGVANIMREDEAEKYDEEIINKMTEQAPQKKEGWIKVKSIL